MQLLAIEQCLNGLALGVMIFLMAAGLTLIFGVMNVINMAHGSVYMMGAYIFASAFARTGSLLFAMTLALVIAFLIGVLLEYVIFRPLYARTHLDQVLVTFGVILVFDEIVRTIWGTSSLNAGVPQWLSGQVEILPGSPYPAYRLVVIGVGLSVALLLYVLVAKTRVGMLIRAGASNRTMVAILGVNIKLMFTMVFALGAVLAALSGLLAAPIYAVEPGMGNNVLILAFVVIVVGGMGSIRGAFVAALLIGLVDTMGRAFLRPLFGAFMSQASADNAGPAIASMLIYILMAMVLVWRPEGLFPPHGRKS